MQHLTLGANALKLWKAYELQLQRRPVRVQVTTSALLWGLGDALAQKVGEGRKNSELDGRRIALTAGFGASFMGPVGHYWYMGLDLWCAKLFTAGTPAFTASKVIIDSTVLGPLYVIAFYAWGAAFIDNTGFAGFKEKIEKDFVPTYCAEMCIWPLFQTLNFTRIPVAHQLLAVNVASLVDASFLSWARSQDDWVTTLLVALHIKTLPQKSEGSKPSEAKSESLAASKLIVAKSATVK